MSNALVNVENRDEANMNSSVGEGTNTLRKKSYLAPAIVLLPLDDIQAGATAGGDGFLQAS